MGLGAGIAKVYAKYEAKLALIDISPELEPFAESLRKEGAEVITFKADVTNAEELKEVAKKIITDILGLGSNEKHNVKSANPSISASFPGDAIKSSTTRSAKNGHILLYLLL